MHLLLDYYILWKIIHVKYYSKIWLKGISYFFFMYIIINKVYLTFPASLPLMFCLETLSIINYYELYKSKLLLDVCNWQDNSNML